MDALVDFLDIQWPARYRHLLVPVDLRATSVPAIRKAVVLARQHRADITLLYVLPRLATLIAADLDHVCAELAIDIVENCQTEALHHLADLIPPEGASLTRCEVAEGIPATEIVRTAVRLNSDLIVLGHRHRRGLKRLLPRRVANEVIRRAPCPVLIVEEQTRYELVRTGH